MLGRIMSIDQRHENSSAHRQPTPRGRDTAEQSAQQLLRGPAIFKRLGISRWTWAHWVKAGQAPAPVPNVPGFPRWLLKDIEDFERGAYGAGRYFRAARLSVLAGGSPRR
jgi:predicted DNA-binding transcriptional regulator AlpA